MELELIYLFAMYGVAFGIQHKLPSMWGGKIKEAFKEGVLNALLSCTYCVGFHAGWIVYILSAAIKDWNINTGELVIYAFAGAAFSYSADAIIKNIEEGGLYEDSEEE